MQPILVGIALPLALALLVDACRRLDRRLLRGRDLALWIALGAAVGALRAMRIDLPEMPVLGFQGGAFLALTLGYQRALISLALLLAAVTPPASLPSAFLVEAALPVWTTLALVALARRRLPPDPFVYLLGCGFFLPFAVGALQLAAALGLATLADAFAGFGTAFVWGLLLLGGEATLVGMVVTVLVAYLPRAVATFDEAYYLAPRRRM